MEMRWKWKVPTEFVMQDGKVLKYLEMTKSEFGHWVREGLRLVRWQAAAKRRWDMQGLEVGADREATTV
eukprot:2646623-Karenia_brevis.AAC.1